MRMPTALSYSGLAQFETNRAEFYLKYLAECRPARQKQEAPASVGSSFDAFVKAQFQHDLGLKKFDDEFAALFEAQVEPHNRDQALENGRYVFECYKLSGVYEQVLAELENAKETPRFEFEVREVIGGVPFIGKPDLRWVSAGGAHIVHDFKVNGFFSKSGTSPTKGYMRCRDGYTGTPSRTHGNSHKLHIPAAFKDILIDASPMERNNPDWADQLSLYGFALGEQVGAENVVLSINQIVGKPTGGFPKLRIAEFRARVLPAYQHKLVERLQACWDAIVNGKLFEDHDAKCAQLERQAARLVGSSPQDQFFNEIARPSFWN